jgi:hypothetical protein
MLLLQGHWTRLRFVRHTFHVRINIIEVQCHNYFQLYFDFIDKIPKSSKFYEFKARHNFSRLRKGRSVKFTVRRTVNEDIMGVEHMLKSTCRTLTFNTGKYCIRHKGKRFMHIYVDVASIYVDLKVFHGTCSWWWGWNFAQSYLNMNYSCDIKIIFKD